MKSNLEIEYKTLITSNQYNLLVSHFINEATLFNQTNTYFDTTPSLKERGMACRIRQINNTYLFTLKIKNQVDLGVVEIEFPVLSCSLLDSNIQEIFKKYDIPSLEEVGSLSTLRYQIELEKGFLCLDKNTYYNTEDYEVEYELKDGYTDDLKFFITLLQQFSIPYVPNAISKIERCLSNKPND